MFGLARASLIGVLFLVLYVAGTYYVLRQSSLPLNPCPSANSTLHKCLSPLLSSIHKVALELWVYDQIQAFNNSTELLSNEGEQIRPQRRQRQARYQWVPVTTCRFGTIVDLSNAKTLLDNCTLLLPDFARKRMQATHQNGKKDTVVSSENVLRAKFVLRRVALDNDAANRNTTRHLIANSITNSIVGEAPFDLTRMVERKVSGSSFFGLANEENEKKISRDLVSPSLVVDTVHKENADNEKKNRGDDDDEQLNMLVPHFKYKRQAVVLRLVQDDQIYGRPPYRGDGIRMQETCPHPCHYYRPVFYVDDVALRHSSQIEMGISGDDRPPVQIKVKLSVITPMRDVIITQLSYWMEMAEKILHPSELDELRYLISDENLYRFILTQFISFVHIWIDCLAFRDEVGFYVGRTDMGGLSVSSVLTRFYCSLIIFLYLLEGGGTSSLILMSVGSSVLVDAWKAWKVLKPKASFRFPFITIRDPSFLSNYERKAMTFDRIATTYLSLLIYPLIAGSAIYAYKHYVYTSWYSWLISNLVNAVYTFGFIALCPQLYVNYRLKSVAHLPWKVFVYKLFNTFIDDVFAFLIEMPLKHKLMTLRDDVVFLLFLYQAFIYRVDMNRPNEFGYVFTEKKE